MACKALPDEIVLMVQSHLTAAERIRTATVSQQWRRCAEDEPYWRDALQRNRDPAIPATLPEGIPS